MGKKITVARYEPYEGYHHDEYDLDTISDYDKKELAKELARGYDGVVIELPGCTRASLGSLYPLYKKYKDEWENGEKEKSQKKAAKLNEKYVRKTTLREEAVQAWNEWFDENRFSYTEKELENLQREYFKEVDKKIAEEVEL